MCSPLPWRGWNEGPRGADPPIPDSARLFSAMRAYLERESRAAGARELAAEKKELSRDVAGHTRGIFDEDRVTSRSAAFFHVSRVSVRPSRSPRDFTS